jgi:magnesium chelatase family protein
MVGGGLKARPGEISLAHRGILFLDELPEFNRTTLESLRQPMETGEVSVARANMHVTYPARFQLVAAMNPCKCGYLGVPGHSCSRAPRCAEEYQSKISGPLLDRIDLQIEVPLVLPWDLAHQREGESSATVRARVEKAQAFGEERRREFNLLANAHADGSALEKIAPMTVEARDFLVKAAQKLMLSGRGYHRMIRIARTIADMEQTEVIQPTHMAEALSYRRIFSFKKD